MDPFSPMPFEMGLLDADGIVGLEGSLIRGTEVPFPWPESGFWPLTFCSLSEELTLLHKIAFLRS